MIGLIALLLANAAHALIITQPLPAAQVYKGKAFGLNVQTSPGETATQANVLFTNGLHTYNVNVPTNSLQNVVLPSDFNGPTGLLATAPLSIDATSSINVVAYNPYPYYPCYNPYYNPCYRPCFRPVCDIPRPRPVCDIPRSRPICNIPRPRQSRCRIRAEESSSDLLESSYPQIILRGLSIYFADEAEAQEQELQQQMLEQELQQQMLEQVQQEVQQVEQPKQA